MKEYLTIILDIFSYFLIKTYDVSTPKKHLGKVLLRSTRNICFYGGQEKFIPELSWNTAPWQVLWSLPGPSCSKLTMSLVNDSNDSLKLTLSDTQICWNFLLKNVSSFCSAKATHIFSAKNIRILYIESAKTVNEMTLNKLVKLTMLWTTGPRTLSEACQAKRCLQGIGKEWKSRSAFVPMQSDQGLSFQLTIAGYYRI